MPSPLHHRAVRTHANQLWKFVICGGLGFILDILSLSIFVEYAAVDPRLAVILSSCVGAIFVFFANKFFTFSNRERTVGRQAFKFALVYGVSIVSNAAISNFLLWVGVYYLFAKVIAIAIGAVWNYALSHGFIFKKSEQIDVAVV